jgi:hypothetical protein
MWSRKNSQPLALRDAAHQFRNDATAKKGGELLETFCFFGRSKPNVDGGVPGGPRSPEHEPGTVAECAYRRKSLISQ